MNSTSFFTFLGAAYLTVLLIAAVCGILQIIAYWKIFRKAGKPGWHSIIPILSTYDHFDIGWKGFWAFILFAIAIVIGIIAPNGVPAEGMNWLLLVLSAAAVVIDVIATHKLSKAFGHGVPFTLGLLFLTPFFLLYLGFGKDQYIGKQ